MQLDADADDDELLFVEIEDGIAGAFGISNWAFWFSICFSVVASLSVCAALSFPVLPTTRFGP
jgi:hypothetical protein